MLGFERYGPQERKAVDADRDPDAEFAFHIEMRTRYLVERGWSPDAAAREARRRFGELDRIRQACAAAGRRPRPEGRAMETLRQDLTFALRALVRHPMHTVLSVAILAVGIGATTAVFSVVDGVLLRSLPYPDADRIVAVSAEHVQLGVTDRTFRKAEWRAFTERAATVDAVGGTYPIEVTVSGIDADAQRLEAAMVTPFFFDVFGVTPSAGRTFGADGTEGADGPLVILSHGFWQRHLGGDPEVLGRPILLSQTPFSIVGILPPTYRPIDGAPELYIPYSVGTDNWIGRWLAIYARMTPEAGVTQVQTELSSLMSRVGETEERSSGWSAAVTPLHERVASGMRPALLALSAAVALVLLVALANVANLAVVRAATREREIAVRMALGAGLRRIARQTVVESTVLALIGGTAGVMLAAFGLEALLRLAPAELPRLDAIAIDGRILGLALIVSVTAGLVFGTAPALYAAASSPVVSLRTNTRSRTRGPRHVRLLSGIVAAEIALSVVLLAAAGLVITSFQRLQRIDPGFDASGAIAAQIALPSAKYSRTQIPRFFQQLASRVEALPDVHRAGVGSNLPLTGRGSWLTANSAPRRAQGLDPVDGLQRVAQPGYFRALGIPLIDGREFDTRDAADAPAVVMINRAMADALWPGERAVGQRLTFRSEPTDDDWLEVVGVVGDVRYQGMDKAPDPQVYQPHTQQTWSEMYLFVRSDREAGDLITAVRATLRQMDRDVPVGRVTTLAGVKDIAVAAQRFNSWIFSLFGAIALFLCAAGIYGVLSFAVSQRTHEIGIRMALGARRVSVMRLILRRGLTLLAVGGVAGLVGALAMARIIQSLLFQTSATDLGALTLAGAILSAAVLLASFIPARRASALDPMVALRDD